MPRNNMNSGLHNHVNTLGTTVPTREQIDGQVTYQLRQALYWLKGPLPKVNKHV